MMDLKVASRSAARAAADLGRQLALVKAASREIRK
jgi:hypothetical protein